MPKSQQSFYDSRLNRLYSHFSSPDYGKPATIKEAINKVINDSSDPQLNWIVTKANAFSPRILHDFGCGIGRLFGALTHLQVNTDKIPLYVGIDLDKNILSVAENVVKRISPESTCVFLTPDEWERSEYLSIQDAIVITNDVFHHMDHKKIAHLFWLLSTKLPERTPLIVGETGMFKRLEPNRIPFSNADFKLFGSLTGLQVTTEPASSAKGLPLTRAIVLVPNSIYGQLNSYKIDDDLRELFSAKIKDLRSRLELGTLEEFATSESTSFILSRVGMLELCQSVEHTLAHWNDTGVFIPFESKVERILIHRRNLQKSFKNFLNDTPRAILCGDFGVGKTTLVKSILPKLDAKQWAATATYSSDRNHFIAWLIQQAKAHGDSRLEKVCLAFARSPDVLLSEIIEVLPPLLLIVDNAHLCNVHFLHQLVESCIETNQRLLLVSSIPPVGLGLHKTIPSFKITGFNLQESADWLERSIGLCPSYKELRNIWRNARNGNPQIMSMRFMADIDSDFPGSFGKLDDCDVRILVSTMLQPEGLRLDEICSIAVVDLQKVQDLQRRALLLKKMGFYGPHDSVTQCLVTDVRYSDLIASLRGKLCYHLLNKYKLADIQNARLKIEHWSDILRLCNQLRLNGDSIMAWEVLEASSYAIYMDGHYNRLIQEISECRKASPPALKPETRPELFWLFLREGRIYKLQGDLTKADVIFSRLKPIAVRRDRLALLKEFAELDRRKGNYDNALKLFKEAIALDRKWARDNRDKLITLKQLGITFAEQGNFRKARSLLLDSMYNRHPDDQYGIASCRRYLAFAGLRHLQVQKQMKTPTVQNIFIEAWTNVITALQQFEKNFDIEGISGTTLTMCELAIWADTNLNRRNCFEVFEDVIQRIGKDLLPFYRKRISHLISSKFELH